MHYKLILLQHRLNYYHNITLRVLIQLLLLQRSIWIHVLHSTKLLPKNYHSSQYRHLASVDTVSTLHSMYRWHKKCLNSHQNGFKMARQFERVQATGSYIIGGRSGRSLRGVYKQLSGTTMRVASSRLEGQTFQLNRTPSLSSFCCINSW